MRRIFVLCAAGNSPSQNARIPKSEKALCSTMYAYERFGSRHMRLALDKPYNWERSTVAHMLEKRVVYRKHTQHEVQQVEYKDKR